MRFQISSILLVILLLINNSIAHDKPHVLVGSKASESGIKGVCNGDPIAYIIRQHPNLLNHKRDKVLRLGAKKSNQYSLQGCVNCHAQKKTNNSGYNAVNDEGQFCATCHEKTATSIDCFECHRTTPYNGKTYYQNHNSVNRDITPTIKK